MNAASLRAAGTAAATALLLAGCSAGKAAPPPGAAATPAADGPELVIGSAGFTESAILAEMYAEVLSNAGFRTSVKTLANRELYEPALEKGQIDVVPEYAATLAEFLNTKANGPNAKPVASSDPAATAAALGRLAGPRGLKVLAAGKAVDQNAFAVSEDFARQHHLRTLSDLGAAKLKIRLAAGDECADRPYCAPGLKKAYGIDISGVDPKGVGTTQAKQAVQDGSDQLVLTTTTDATLEQFDLVLLTDDKHLQNADNVLPVVNAKDAGDPRIATALGRLGAVLTTADLARLDKKVDARRHKPGEVAEAYVKEKGL